MVFIFILAYLIIIMNLLVWNISNIANNLSIRRLKKLLKSNNLSCAAIFKSKINSTHINDIKFKLKRVDVVSNNEGNIWILWRSDFKCSIVHSCSQYIVVQTQLSNIDVIVFFVHASYDNIVRLDLWNDFINVNCVTP